MCQVKVLSIYQLEILNQISEHFDNVNSKNEDDYNNNNDIKYEENDDDYSSNMADFEKITALEDEDTINEDSASLRIDENLTSIPVPDFDASLGNDFGNFSELDSDNFSENDLDFDASLDEKF